MKLLFTFFIGAITVMACNKVVSFPSEEYVVGKWDYIGQYIDGKYSPERRDLHYHFEEDKKYTYYNNYATPVNGQYEINTGFGADSIVLYPHNRLSIKYGYSRKKDTLFLNITGGENGVSTVWLSARWLQNHLKLF